VEVVQRALVVGRAHAQHGARLERVRVATLEGESAAHLVRLRLRVRARVRVRVRVGV
jgi:hypothetical protein